MTTISQKRVIRDKRGEKKSTDTLSQVRLTTHE